MCLPTYMHVTFVSRPRSRSDRAGSDEHGVPITLKARKEGVTPQDIVDRYHKLIKESFQGLGISFDVYSRTTSDIHHKTASEFFRHLYDKGEFIEKESMQLFDPEAGQFLADRYVTGECPHCHNPRAYGDQCEACGTALAATELINPKSAISGACARAEAHTPLVSAAGPLGTHPTPLDSRRAPGMAPQRVRPVQKLARHGACSHAP